MKIARTARNAIRWRSRTPWLDAAVGLAGVVLLWHRFGREAGAIAAVIWLMGISCSLATLHAQRARAVAQLGRLAERYETACLRLAYREGEGAHSYGHVAQTIKHLRGSFEEAMGGDQGG